MLFFNGNEPLGPNKDEKPQRQHPPPLPRLRLQKEPFAALPPAPAAPINPPAGRSAELRRPDEREKCLPPLRDAAGLKMSGADVWQ